MIGLMFLAGIGIWLVMVIFLTIWIPRVLRDGWPRTIVRLILFPVLLVLPIVDEWIGSVQFKELCEKENVVYLADDWQKIKRAKNAASPYLEDVKGYAVRIEKQEVKYQDMDTGNIFFHFNIYHNYGGFLLDKMKLRLSASPSDCWPNGASEIYNKIHLDKIIQQQGFK